MLAPHTSKQFSVGVYDKKHLRNLSSRLRKVLALLDDAAVKAVKIGRRTGFRDEEKDFHFDDFPQARREIDALLGELASGLSVNVREGISEAWGTSNAKNDAMVDSMLGAAGAGLPKKATRRWYNHNERAMNAFIRRREAGMGLSENVWNLAQFKEELELALESGLVQGVSAAEMSRDVRSCLRNPDKLFRRVRDEKGVLRLSRAAQAYHPGRGVYRSSYKNALRLTATETNMAYRTADNKRWGQIDFVLGQHIEPSRTNHPVVDICDELKGDYPKDFKFVGWHPFCRCFAVPKMASPEKFLEYQQAILDGKDVSDWKWEGEVKDVPKNFKDWVKENEERISRAKSLPYFLKDNPKYADVTNKAVFTDIWGKVSRILKPSEQRAYVVFEPFSHIVIEKLRERKDLKRRMRLFDEIVSDERATVLSTVGEARTVMFPGHKGRQHGTWKGITQMGKDLNERGESVAFLPELDKATSADALVLFRKRPAVADFKYCTTKKANTLAVDLEKGFGQAGTIVVKLESMDAGAFKDAVDYLVRNNIPYGNIKLLNKYGDFIEITEKDIRFGAYKKKLKGFL